MRIVIDLQGAQSTGSRNRGIGRYSLSLAQGIAQNRGNNEVFVVLSSLFPETIQALRQAFHGLLPPENIHVWGAEGPVSEIGEIDHRPRRERAEAIREGYLGSLHPDVVLVTSLFEGFTDDAVTSIGSVSSCPTAVVLFDLIPLINRDVYLSNPVMRDWYDGKIDHLRQAKLLLSISASSGREAVEYLGFAQDRVVNISTACSSHFRPIETSVSERKELLRKYGLHRPFLMYTGGIDHRKNIEGLIRAFALIPSAFRIQYQLAVVCSAHQSDRDRLMKLASESGLRADELVMTGFVPEDDLVGLYNACTLFVFPSWHEGFGLPALEAMQCGKAVIAANTSSLPEVVGREDALFDPRDDQSIADKMQQVLTDDSFRRELESHGLAQSRKFSWDITAQRAVRAMELFHANRPLRVLEKPKVDKRPRMAYVSPLPPERSGISDYSAELLRVLTEWYDIDVIVDQPQISDDWINSNCHPRDIVWFKECYWSYDRVVYHFGNSPFHAHMFDLVSAFPGVVVLHDFYLSDVQAYREATGQKPNAWKRELKHSHGYKALHDSLMSLDDGSQGRLYPSNLSVVQSALGVIVHSNYSHDLFNDWYGGGCGDVFVIPLLRSPAQAKNRYESRKELGLSDSDVLICSFGLVGEEKLSHRLLDCFLRSSLIEGKSARLVFVGENNQSDYGQQLRAKIHETGLGVDQVHITGWVGPEEYRAYLSAADIGVQLRTQSRGETSAAVLDCMNYGLATIVNANGSMASLDPSSVLMLPDQFDDQELVAALEHLFLDARAREELGRSARSVIAEKHAPESCAEQYAQAIERIYERDNGAFGGVVRTVSKMVVDQQEMLRTARTLSENFPPVPRQKQLLVDVSTLVHVDAKSGIQRVVRAILREWLLNPPVGWSVEPVYATTDSHGYRYAEHFVSRFLGIDAGWAEDGWVDAWQGDVFVGLDLQHYVVPAQKDFLSLWKNRGVSIHFVVYDLLPLLMPKLFKQEMQDLHREWLHTIRAFDGAVCISEAVATELEQWFADEGMAVDSFFKLDWFHLGADIAQSVPSQGVPTGATEILRQLRARPSFLMVGTLEPRKGHAQVLAGFDALWEAGEDVSLVLVGKKGWLVDDLVPRLKSHPEAGHRLFWLEGISDEFLEQIYAASSCLIAASEAEGFGLPLIEAAQKQLPILARDIPVFREVAGEHAFYFQGLEGKDIAQAVHEWLALFAKRRHPVTEGMTWLDWHQSAEMLFERVTQR